MEECIALEKFVDIMIQGIVEIYGDVSKNFPKSLLRFVDDIY